MLLVPQDFMGALDPIHGPILTLRGLPIDFLYAPEVNYVVLAHASKLVATSREFYVPHFVLVFPQYCNALCWEHLLGAYVILQ